MFIVLINPKNIFPEAWKPCLVALMSYVFLVFELNHPYVKTFFKKKKKS